MPSVLQHTRVDKQLTAQASMQRMMQRAGRPANTQTAHPHHYSAHAEALLVTNNVDANATAVAFHR